MRRVKVWDLPVRLFHLGLAVSIGLALWTADEDETIPLHVRIGLAVLGLLVFRVLWGLVGSREARFSTFVRSPRQTLEYARAALRGRPPHVLGHNPLGAWMVLVMLGALLAMTVTGILVYLGPEWNGPLASVIPGSAAHAIAEVHELLGELFPWLIALHVIGVIVSSRLERQNLVRGMITGMKRASPVIAIAVATSLAVAPAGAAEPPNAILESLVAEAKSEDATFGGASAERGRELFLRDHGGSSRPPTCAGCHLEDPRRRGRSPAGKNIEPLAPSANPERFTDRRHVNKWFDRNCKQVLGRVCTPKEKADVLAWLLTL